MTETRSTALRTSSAASSEDKREEQRILQEELNILKDGICQGRNRLPCPVPYYVSGDSVYYQLLLNGRLIEVFHDRLLYYRKETGLFPYESPVILKKTGINTT